jgi:hypothetical protein
MVGMFWTSYAVLAGTALGFAGTAIGLIVARDRRARPSTHSDPERSQFSPSKRR